MKQKTITIPVELYKKSLWFARTTWLLFGLGLGIVSMSIVGYFALKNVKPASLPESAIKEMKKQFYMQGKKDGLMLVINYDRRITGLSEFQSIEEFDKWLDNEHKANERVLQFLNEELARRKAKKKPEQTIVNKKAPWLQQ